MMNSLSKTRIICNQLLAPLTLFGLLILLVPFGVFAQTPNQPPVAVNDTAITPEGTPVVINVASNDSDPDGNLDPSSVTIETDPANGEAVSVGDGTVTYTPDPDFAGANSFTYQICDSEASCVTATVDVEVEEVEVAIQASFNVIPRKLNVKKRGVIPVAVFSTADLDVATIDPASLRIEGSVAPLRSKLVRGRHGSGRLNLKFSAQEIVAAIGEVTHGQEVVLHLTGNLDEDAEGIAFVGEDTVLIIKKGK